MDSTLAPAPAHVPAGLVFDFDIYGDPRMGDDVQASYAEVLKDAPDIFYTRCNGGHWVVRRHAPIEAILHDYEHFSAREMFIPRVPDQPVVLPLSLDPPASIPFRHAMMPPFTAAAVRKLEPRIRDWAIRIIADVADGDGCDFVADVAALFPVSVFMELMDMPRERLREFRAITERYFRTHDQATIDSTREVVLGLFKTLVEQRLSRPGKDMISQLLTADLGGRTATHDEMMAMCFLLFLAGMDTVTNLSSFAYRRLAADPALQDRLRADESLIPQFVEESLRCFGVVNPCRLVIKDYDDLGAPFRAGDMLMCLGSEAARDPQVNADPHRFDIDRPRPVHLAFATGPHLCIGHILARTELRILTEEWLRRIPRFSLRPSAPLGFRIGPILALESLPLEWPG